METNCLIGQSDQNATVHHKPPILLPQASSVRPRIALLILKTTPAVYSVTTMSLTITLQFNQYNNEMSQSIKPTTTRAKNDTLQ